MVREGSDLAASVRRTRNVALARGAVRVAFGILALTWPGLTVLALAIVFGAFALVDGVSALVAARRRQQDTRFRPVLMWFGAVGVALGVITLIWPSVTVGAIVLLFGVWAIVRGAGEVMTAIRIRRLVTGELWMGLAGAATFLAGVIVLVQPSIGVDALGIIVGIAALLTGTLLVIGGWNLNRFLRTATG